MLSLKLRLLVAGALLLPGCGGGTPPATAPAPTTTPAPEPPQAAPAPESPQAAPTSIPESLPVVDAGTTASVEKQPASPPAPAKPAPLPEGTTVLHIGDSFAGALGIDLDHEFKEAGVRGILKYETSSYIPTWAWNKKLDQYIWSFKPDLVLITLGANELEVPDPTQRIPAIHRLIKRLGDRPCVWVAPPLWEGARDALLAVLKENVAPCLYLDSGTLVPDLPRARDGIHPSMNARKVWARAVFDWLARHRTPTPDRPWALGQ